jgi:hypothetical protein
MNNILELMGVVDNSVIEQTRKCIRCSQVKLISEFQTNRSSYDNRCRDCKLKYQKELNQVRKNPNIPPMPTHCDCCGKENPKLSNPFATNLALDHHYDDNGLPFFRGWICKQCNSGIGYLGDNASSIFKAFVYLLSSLPEKQKWSTLKEMIATFPEERHQEIVTDILNDLEKDKNND